MELVYFYPTQKAQDQDVWLGGHREGKQSTNAWVWGVTTDWDKDDICIEESWTRMKENGQNLSGKEAGKEDKIKGELRRGD